MEKHVVKLPAVAKTKQVIAMPTVEQNLKKVLNLKRKKTVRLKRESAVVAKIKKQAKSIKNRLF